MTNSQQRNEEENLEILEFYIDLLKEKVENFQKSPILQNQKLNRFIAEYIDLEDKILNTFNNISITGPENEKKMDELTDVFNVYWSKFQDTWEEDMWSIYNMYRNLNEKDSKEEYNKNNFISSNNAEFTVDGSKNTISKDEEVNFNQSIKKNVSIPPRRENFTNLNKIDEDIDNISDITIDKRQEDKKRNCVDLQCILF